MKKISSVLLGLFVISFSVAVHAQELVNIKPLLDMMRDGRSQDVKNLLPVLTKEHPADPGILFLNAAFDDDAAAAVRVYKDIIKKNPETVAATESAKRLVNYFQVTGNPKEADEYITFLGGISETKEEVKEIKKINTSIKDLKKEEKPIAASTSKFYVQIGAFGTKANGEAQLKKASKKGFKGTVVKDGKLFKPRIGPYKTQEEADSALEKLKKTLSMKGFVIEQ